MSDDKRVKAFSDRRARQRGGRRGNDSGRPWYAKHGLWLAAASMIFVSWKRVTRLV